MDDATKALEMNPENFKAVVAFGNALYGMGEFEKGLVVFKRGWRKRMDTKMKEGMQKCRIAIENAVGCNSKQFDHEIVEKVIADMEKGELPKVDNATLEAERLQEAYKSERKRKQEKERRERKRKKLDKILLGRVAEDCSFLRILAGVDEEFVEDELTEHQVDLEVILI